MERICQFEKGHLLSHVEEQCVDILAIYRAMGLDPMVEPKTAVSIIGTGQPFCNYCGRMSMLLNLTEARMNGLPSAADLERQLRDDAAQIEPHLKNGIDLEDWERSWPYLSFPLPEEDLALLKVALALQVEKHLGLFENGTAEAYPEEIEISLRKIDRINHIAEKHFTARSGITEGVTKNGVIAKERICEFINQGMFPYVEQYCQDILFQYRAMGIDPMVEPPTAMSVFFTREVSFFTYYDRMMNLLGLTGARRYLESPNVYKGQYESLEQFQTKYQKREAEYLEELLTDIKKIKPFVEQGFDFISWEWMCPYLTFPIPEDEVEYLKKKLRTDLTQDLNVFRPLFEPNMLESPYCIDIKLRHIKQESNLLRLHYLAIRSAAG